MSPHSISEVFVQDGQRCNSINERILDWNHVQVTRECQFE
jgi:hypothetical protein